jgi:4-amino-4-deoxy-L-arabinose transferase-like glycosyltransferase
LAVIAASSPVLIYFVGLGMHQGFTHSALVGAASAATLCVLLKIAENGSWKAYLQLGLVLGIGLQSKYSFGLIAAAMIVAWYWTEVSERVDKRQLHPGRLTISIVIGLVIVAPSVWWLVGGHDLSGVLGGYVNYKPGGGATAELGRIPSLWSIVRSSAAFIASFLIPAILFFPRVLRRLQVRTAHHSLDGGAMLGRFFIVFYLLIATASLMGVLEHVKIRWMYPVLILFPLYFFYRLESVGYEAAQLRRWQYLLLGYVALTIVLWILQPWFGGLLCGRCRLFEPYPQFLRNRLLPQVVSMTALSSLLMNILLATCARNFPSRARCA